MNFEFLTAGKVVFGRNKFEQLADSAGELGSRFLIVSGSGALRDNGVLGSLESQLEAKGKAYVHYSGVRREPEPADVDEGARLARKHGCDAVIGLGGGSVLDCAKAIAALITNEGPVEDYLEGVGVGRKLTRGPVPFVAVPTTSGTGSEVTKNAVISSRSKGYKKSFRDDRMLADIALVDPALTVTLPKSETAASGLDALCQLIESYVSVRSNPLIKSLATLGMTYCAASLKPAYDNGKDLVAREGMAMASLLSGMCLCNAGLGAAHGIAAALGAHLDMPHGLCCGILLPHVMEYNMDAALHEYDEVGRALLGEEFLEPGQGARSAVDYLITLNSELGIPRDFKQVRVDQAKLELIAVGSQGSSMSGNPKRMDERACFAFLSELFDTSLGHHQNPDRKPC
ncbi:MAG: iron-containing alcohol dehydrogenase [Christensenellales bacterium]|jgi:alcohol dehydrogenase class IV